MHDSAEMQNNGSYSLTEISPHDGIQAIKLKKLFITKKTPAITVEKIVNAKKGTNYFWTDAENRRYASFLQEFSHLFELSPEERRLKKVNLLMSKKVRTRNTTQCHSHHQKMLEKYGSIKNIIFQIKESSQCGAKCELPHLTECKSSEPWMKPTQSPSLELLQGDSCPGATDKATLVERFEEYPQYNEFTETLLLKWIEW